MTTATAQIDGTRLMEQFVPASPLVGHLGIELVDLSDGRATLRLPFRDHNITIGTVVHGGAIAALIDTAVMAAAWSGADVPDALRGSTVSLSVNFVAAADACDLEATATVTRRGRRLTSVTVEVTAPDDRIVATAIATYQVG